MIHLDCESLYAKFPIWLQNVACNFQGYRIKRTRFGKKFYKFLSDAEKRSQWSQDQIIAFRNNKLREFVKYCAKNVPYYRNLFKKIGFDPHNVKDLQDLQGLPILKKTDVQNNYSDLLSEAVSSRQTITAHTSGSTGGGLRFATTLDAIQQEYATWWRYWRWHGIPMQAWCGYFGGRVVVPASQKRPPFWRYNFPGRQILFSGYHIGPQTIGSYIKALNKVRPPWLHGYPSLLALVASYLIQEKEKLQYQPKWVSIGAENLLLQQSQLMQKAFGRRPIQHYGTGEAVANFSECEHGELHVDEDFAAVEFIPNKDGTYKVIGTNFSNLATAFLRYETGDVVTLKEGFCPCGKPGRLVGNIDGRIEDYAILKNGTLLGRLDFVFKDMMHIREVQICQEKIGELIVYIVRGNNYSESDEQMVIREFRKRIGNNAEIKIKYVDKLMRSQSGKLRFAVSYIKEGKLNAI